MPAMPRLRSQGSAMSPAVQRAAARPARATELHADVGSEDWSTRLVPDLDLAEDELTRSLAGKRSRRIVAGHVHLTPAPAGRQERKMRRRASMADDNAAADQATLEPAGKRQRPSVEIGLEAAGDDSTVGAPARATRSRDEHVEAPAGGGLAPGDVFQPNVKFPYLRTRPRPDLMYPLKFRWTRDVIRPQLVQPRAEPLEHLDADVVALAHIIRGRLPKMPKEHIRNSISRDHTLLATRPSVDGNTIGGATVRFLGNGAAEIVYFVVWDQHKGFGHQLMERLKRDASAAGYKWLVTAGDDTSKGFWLKEGFSTDVSSVPKSVLAATDVFIYEHAIPMVCSLRTTKQCSSV
eukprot:TRINITY_DN5792_c0_g1_i1.p1 TRINITY_DN5792_c0_g1~~TRINITY_DN5792_c0_g1_i1.p1  ORF type:complete len:350 (+),score=38.23 TRINITY_DN5792_c0_g1_i1:132-1181(+)